MTLEILERPKDRTVEASLLFIEPDSIKPEVAFGYESGVAETNAIYTPRKVALHDARRTLPYLDAVFGSDRKAKTSRSYKAAMSQLAESQKQRGKRRTLDVVDRCLMDLVSVYRDVIALQTGAPGDLVNEEMRGEVAELARRSTPEQNLRRIDAVFAAREKMMEFQVPPLLAHTEGEGQRVLDRSRIELVNDDLVVLRRFTYRETRGDPYGI